MMEVLRDAIWQFIGAILAFLALVISIVLYRKQKSKKLLVWDARSVVPLLSVHKSVEDDLQISFRGRAVMEAYMVSIMLANEGNTPITRTDYDRALEIYLSGGGELISLDLANNNIELTGNIEEPDIIRVDPFLLNPGERVYIRSIVLNHAPKIEVRTRIIGGSALNCSQFESRLSQKIKHGLLNFLDLPNLPTVLVILGTLIGIWLGSRS